MPDFSKIKAITFDVDGVMTDGGLLCFDDGNLLRVFNAKDTMGLRMAAMAGIHLGVITGGRSQSISARFKTCGVPDENVYLGSRNKLTPFYDFCKKYSLDLSEVAYVGDDIPDIPVLKVCGMAVCPSDAIAEVKEIADFVSPFPGGKGCMRHLVEQVLKSQDLWHFDVKQYECTF